MPVISGKDEEYPDVIYHDAEEKNLAYETATFHPENLKKSLVRSK